MCANWYIFSVALVSLVFAVCRADNEEFPFSKQCGIQVDQDKIVQGELANIDEYPWMALLKFKQEDVVFYACGGALINNRYVLTAAHCVVSKYGAPFEVTLGEYDTESAVDCIKREGGRQECSPAPQSFQIEEIVKHPEYVKSSPQKLHDIAILRLKSPVVYSDFIKPICVPTDEINAKIFKIQERTLDVAGWGRTRHKASSNIKRRARVPVVDNETCSKNRLHKIASSQLCAGGGKQDSCQGDSGGPLMGINVEDVTVRWYMSGIVSFGTRECGVQGVPAVYTNVASYRDWIVKNMKP